jgi:hypothetical protein
VLTVDWAGSPPARQHKLRAARDARYALLTGACAAEGAASLLTAHHAGDQAETLLLRLLHASGVDGLACMPLATRAHGGAPGVRLLRPLLRAHKPELEALCRRLGLPFAVDPSNQDGAYQRNRLRQLLWAGAPAGAGGAPQLVLDALLLQRLCAGVSRAAQLQAEALLRGAVVQAAPAVDLPRRGARGGAARARAEGGAPRPAWLIDWATRAARASHALAPVPHAILHAAHFREAPEATAAAALARVLQEVAGKQYPPGLSDCLKLARRLGGGALVGAFTGGGCVAQPLVRSKGRYVLVVPQEHQAWARQALRPPPREAAPASSDDERETQDEAEAEA